MDIKLLIKGRRGKLVVQRVQNGKVRLKFGLKTKAILQVIFREDNVCNEALHVIGLYGPGDKVSLSLSLLLKYWELARVALICHMALDVLCQEMHEAW